MFHDVHGKEVEAWEGDEFTKNFSVIGTCPDTPNCFVVKRLVDDGYIMGTVMVTDRFGGTIFYDFQSFESEA